MVCVRQYTSNTMFTILSLNLASVNVHTTIIKVPYMANSRARDGLSVSLVQDLAEKALETKLDFYKSQNIPA